MDEWSLHACNASKGKTGFSCTGGTLGANTLKGAWWQAWRPWSAAGWRLQCWQCQYPGLLALEKGWSQVLGEIGFKLMSGGFFPVIVTYFRITFYFKKALWSHFSCCHRYKTVTAKNIFNWPLL